MHSIIAVVDKKGDLKRQEQREAKNIPPNDEILAKLWIRFGAMEKGIKRLESGIERLESTTSFTNSSVNVMRQMMDITARNNPDPECQKQLKELRKIPFVLDFDEELEENEEFVLENENGDEKKN